MRRDDENSLRLAILFLPILRRLSHRYNCIALHLFFSETRSNKKNEEEEEGDGKNRFLEPDRFFSSPSIEQNSNGFRRRSERRILVRPITPRYTYLTFLLLPVTTGQIRLSNIGASRYKWKRIPARWQWRGNRRGPVRTGESCVEYAEGSGSGGIGALKAGGEIPDGRGL